MQKALCCFRVWLPYGSRQRGSEVSDPFSCHFQEVQLNASLFCSLQVNLITRSLVSETSFTDLNLFWSWRGSFMLLNLLISIY